MPPYTTGTHAENWDDSVVPKSVREYLATGAEVGNRNPALFRAACQCHHAGMTKADVEERLVARAVADGLSEAEARRAIESAYQQEMREPPRNPSSGASPDAEKAAQGLPAPMPDGFHIFMETVFHDGERLAIGKGSRNGDGTLSIDYGDVRLRRMWLASGPPQNPEGVFSRINPMQYRGAKNNQVTAYRNTLVEFDYDKNGQPVSKEIQYAILLKSGFPIRAVVDSGNKSLQALVGVDAADKAQYDDGLSSFMIISGNTIFLTIAIVPKINGAGCQAANASSSMRPATLPASLAKNCLRSRSDRQTGPIIKTSSKPPKRNAGNMIRKKWLGFSVKTDRFRHR